MIIAVILTTIGLFVIAILIELLNEKFLKSSPTQIEQKSTDNQIYKKKNIMTKSEYSFYLKIKDLEAYYKIVPQINLATIIDKTDNSKFRNELFRNIDFAVFTKDYSTILLLIELNDTSHEKYSRKQRDIKVEEICKTSGIPLIKFYTKYSNEKEYVINRILKEINSQKSEQSSQNIHN